MKQSKIIPKTAAAPKCQTCHDQNGDHGAMNGWGFLAVRPPRPEDKRWAAEMRPKR